MLKLNSFKLASSVSISSSTVSHSPGSQRDALGNGEGWISSPTDQNFGGDVFDMLYRCKGGLVRGGRWAWVSAGFDQVYVYINVR